MRWSIHREQELGTVLCEDVAGAGLGDEVCAGEAAEVGADSRIAYVEDVCGFPGSQGAINAYQKQQDDGGFLDAAQEHDFVGVQI